VVENKNAEQIVKMGIDKEIVSKVISLIDRAEYKRRQSAPGPRITQRAFGKDWRLPITNGYREK
jgi:NAD+ synthase (glutamine-hydrolysing)